VPIKTDRIYITNIPVVAKKKLVYIAKHRNGITVSSLIKNVICSKIIREHEEKYGVISAEQMEQSKE
jgi:hypothetical protein